MMHIDAAMMDKVKRLLDDLPGSIRVRSVHIGGPEAGLLEVDVDFDTDEDPRFGKLDKKDPNRLPDYLLTFDPGIHFPEDGEVWGTITAQIDVREEFEGGMGR